MQLILYSRFVWTSVHVRWENKDTLWNWAEELVKKNILKSNNANYSITMCPTQSENENSSHCCLGIPFSTKYFCDNPAFCMDCWQWKSKFFSFWGRPFKTSMIFGYILTIFSLMLIKAYFLLDSEMYHKTKHSFFCFSNLSIALRNHNFCSFTCHFVLSIHFWENPKQFLID